MDLRAVDCLHKVILVWFQCEGGMLTWKLGDGDCNFASEGEREIYIPFLKAGCKKVEKDRRNNFCMIENGLKVVDVERKSMKLVLGKLLEQIILRQGSFA